MRQDPHLVQLFTVWRYYGPGRGKGMHFRIVYIEDDTIFATNFDLSFRGALADFLTVFQFASKSHA